MFILAADISLRAVIAAAAVGLVLVVLRVRSGAARHAAWLAVVLAMLSMPVLTAIVPRVDVPVPGAFDFREAIQEPGSYQAFATAVPPDSPPTQLPALAAAPH